MSTIAMMLSIYYNVTIGVHSTPLYLATLLSHDPLKATGFFKNEVDFLSNFYRFEKEGWVWKAVPK